MGIVVRFPVHARTSLERGACAPASLSKVIRLPRFLPKRTRAGHQSAGMRLRERQLETVDKLVPTASATAVVPPSSSMIRSTDMEGLYFTGREPVKLHRLGSDFSHKMWKIGLMGTSRAAIAKRLMALQDAYDITQAELCRAIDIKENRYSQYINGKRDLTIDVARKLRAEYGATLDWLYEGDPSGLPMELHKKLSRVAAA